MADRSDIDRSDIERPEYNDTRSSDYDFIF
jgi:hypothetical protein